MFNLRDLIYSQSQNAVDFDSQSSFNGGLPLSQLSNQGTVGGPGTWSQPSQQSLSQEQLAIDRILYSIEDNEDTNAVTDFDDRHPKKKRLIANFDHIPNDKNASKHYKEALEVYEFGNTRTGSHFKSYAPGLNGFVRFPQSELYEPVHRRQILRTLTTDCYFGKDKSGTLIILKEIAKIMTVEFPHLYMLLDILRDFKDGQEYLFKIYQAVVQRKPSRYRFNRCREIALLSDVFLSIGAVEAVSNLFESKIADPAFNQSPSLIATHALLICQRAILISHELLALFSPDDLQSVFAPFGLQEVPTVSQISAQPLKFAVCIRLINTKGSTIENELKQLKRASSHDRNYVASEIKNLQFKCRKVLVDLKGSLISASSLMENQSEDGATAATGLYAMCVAFFEGMEQYDKAWQYLMDIWTKEFPTVTATTTTAAAATDNRAVNTESQQLFLRLTAEYICNFKLQPLIDKNRNRMKPYLINTVRTGPRTALINHAIATLLTVFQKLVSLPVPRKTPELVYLTVVLNRLSILTSAEATTVLCDAVEYSLPKKTHATSRVCFRHVKGMNYRPVNQDIDSDHPGGVDIYHWYIWRTLSTLLGPLPGPAMAVHDALEPHSDLYPYFQGGAKNSFGILRENMPAAESLAVDEFVFVEKESPPEIEFPFLNADEDANEDEDEWLGFTKEEARQRLWWRSSILAAHQLGDFADTPTFTTSKARAIVDALPTMTYDDEEEEEDGNDAYRLQGYLVPGLPVNRYTASNDNDIDNDSNMDVDEDDDEDDLFDSLGLDFLDDRITRHSEATAVDIEELKSKKLSVLAELIHLFSSEVFLSPLMTAFFNDAVSDISFHVSKVTNGYKQETSVKSRTKNKNKNKNNTANSNSTNEVSRGVRLGNGLLEILSFQAIVSSHLAKSQDNVFIVRAVETLIEHAIAAEDDPTASGRDGSCSGSGSAAALKCLSYLSSLGVNLHRCLHLSSLIANYTEASVNNPTPPLRGSDQRVQSVSFFGNPLASTYKPNTAF